MATQMVFMRNEKKYLMSKGQWEELMPLLRAHLNPDGYGLHTICSLYLDSEDFYCARRQLERPRFREKLRLRSYGVPRDDSEVYLELKKKLDGVTYKRRTSLPYRQAGEILQKGVDLREKDQVLGEIGWFMEKIKPVPQVLICYDRIALNGREDARLRITFDRNVRWRQSNLHMHRGDWGTLLTQPGAVLMEVKTEGALPPWLARVLSKCGIFSQSMSKYCTVVKELEAANGFQPGRLNEATQNAQEARQYAG